ncbi:ABC transporter permease [Psychromonas ossibalaenae]|uniref:ABC transporter permease n=1 Tax=Psychromonas ossibalaenae TaxID=444922 RepID=UPI00037E0C5E|nr:ABC transporter permease [Psychromonas ossibalaenae]
MALLQTWQRMRSNPIHEKRWQQFKRNRRGFWSLWIFSGLFLLSLLGELWVNDKPVMISYQDQWYFPVIQDVPENKLGGDFDISTDYHDAYMVKQIEKEGWILWPLIPFYYDSINYELTESAPSPPNHINYLGTDDQGRDVAARLVYGFRISVFFALALTLCSSIIGVIVGAVNGYYGGRIDLFGQRLLEIWEGLPMLFMLIILASFVEPTFLWLLGLMILFSWPGLVGIVRAEFLRGRNLEYVKAARALGVSDNQIMFRHILPNALIATLTFMPYLFTGALTTLTSLDFLGFGLPLGSASLGEMVAQGKNNLHAPWLAISAFISLSSILVLLVFIGEAVRDAFDPRKIL